MKEQRIGRRMRSALTPTVQEKSVKEGSRETSLFRLMGLSEKQDEAASKPPLRRKVCTLSKGGVVVMQKQSAGGAVKNQIYPITETGKTLPHPDSKKGSVSHLETNKSGGERKSLAALPPPP